MRLLRILLVVFVVELAVVGYLARARLSRIKPPLPDVATSDPVLMEDFQRLAGAATDGGTAEWLELGQALLGHGFYAQAELCFRHVLDARPDSRKTRTALAFCLHRTGRIRGSIAEYERILESWEPESSEDGVARAKCIYEIGRGYLRLEEKEQAERAFRRAPDFLPARYQLAHLLLRTDRAKEALPLIDSVLEHRPESLKFRGLQARVLSALGQEKQARVAAEKLERSRQIVPLNLGMDFVEQYHVRYGMNRRIEEFNRVVSSGDLDAMASTLKELLRIGRNQQSPHDRTFALRLLEVELSRGASERMLALIEELRELGENSPELLRYEGEALALKGNLEAAVKCWKRALKMSPENIEIHEKLADYCKQQGDESEANRHLALIWRTKGKKFYRSNQLLQARSAIEKSLQFNPDDPQAIRYREKIERLLSGGETSGVE